jgi:hypothetical protein
MRRTKTARTINKHARRAPLLKDFHSLLRIGEEKDKCYDLSPKEFGEKLAREAIKKIEENVEIK